MPSPGHNTCSSVFTSCICLIIMHRNIKLNSGAMAHIFCAIYPDAHWTEENYPWRILNERFIVPLFFSLNQLFSYMANKLLLPFLWILYVNGGFYFMLATYKGNVFIKERSFRFNVTLRNENTNIHKMLCFHHPNGCHLSYVYECNNNFCKWIIQYHIHCLFQKALGSVNTMFFNRLLVCFSFPHWG